MHLTVIIKLPCRISTISILRISVRYCLKSPNSFLSDGSTLLRYLEAMSLKTPWELGTFSIFIWSLSLSVKKFKQITCEAWHISTISDKIRWDTLPKGTSRHEIWAFPCNTANCFWPISDRIDGVPLYKIFVHWKLKLLSFLVDSFLKLPTQTTLNFERQGWKWILLGEQLCWERGVGNEAKADQNTDCNGVESTCIAGLFYSSFDLHCTDRIKTTNTPTLNIEG